MERKETHSSFGGRAGSLETQVRVVKRGSKLRDLPASTGKKIEKVSLLYWLSGLTCTEQNFIGKAGAQRVVAELGIAIVAPDTSPRGTDVAGCLSFRKAAIYRDDNIRIEMRIHMC